MRSGPAAPSVVFYLPHCYHHLPIPLTSPRQATSSRYA